jgi:hypothetical protein
VKVLLMVTMPVLFKVFRIVRLTHKIAMRTGATCWRFTSFKIYSHICTCVCIEFHFQLLRIFLFILPNLLKFYLVRFVLLVVCSNEASLVLILRKLKHLTSRCKRFLVEPRVRGMYAYRKKKKTDSVVVCVSHYALQ